MKIDLTKIKNALLLEHYEDVVTELSDFQDSFERGEYLPFVKNVDEVVEFLISNIIKCKNEDVLSEMLDTLHGAVTFNDMKIYKEINFDLLAENINNIKDDKILMDYIIILGYTYQPKYISIIEPFVYCDNCGVSEVAKLSLMELGHRKI